jgi:hypothetical protein
MKKKKLCRKPGCTAGRNLLAGVLVSSAPLFGCQQQVESEAIECAVFFD